MGTVKTVSMKKKTLGGTVCESCQTDDNSTKPIQPIQRYRRIINQFEQVTRANLGTCVQVADLSRIAGINQRTLSRAFREACGIGPCRYLQHLRLSEVKRVLLSEEVTVTQAAMRFGFVELGRFGVLYKKAFGETPSATRRRRQAVREVSPPDPPLVPNEAEGTVS